MGTPRRTGVVRRTTAARKAQTHAGSSSRAGRATAGRATAGRATAAKVTLTKVTLTKVTLVRGGIRTGASRLTTGTSRTGDHREIMSGTRGRNTTSAVLAVSQTIRRPTCCASSSAGSAERAGLQSFGETFGRYSTLPGED